MRRIRFGATAERSGRQMGETVMSINAAVSPVTGAVKRTAQQTQALEQLFCRIGEVSSLPGSAVRIIQIANDEKCGASDLIETVESDPSLAVRVLRTVNSTFYSVRNRVGNLKTAVTLLGLKEVRNLALTVHVSRMFVAPGDYRTYRRESLWRHLVSVAAVSRLVAEVCDAAPRDDAYVAGLLHDIGLILLDQHMRRHFKEVLDTLEQYPSTITAERAVLSFHHGELGQFVTRKWSLSDAISAAAGYHHEPERYTGPHRNMVNLTAVANYLCTRNDISSLGVKNVEPPPDRCYRELGIHADHMATILERLGETLEGAAQAAAM
ncbi:MAG TPA: HDOD domain-containing protein [Pirellulales bacterium]|nr:HDOD domain-containing protein [Pirellulales bacterium]